VIVFLFYNKNLSGTGVNCLLYLLQKFQGKALLKQFHDTITVALAEDLATGQHARPTGRLVNAVTFTFSWLSFLICLVA
jgi:hypothetical protein